MVSVVPLAVCDPSVRVRVDVSVQQNPVLTQSVRVVTRCHDLVLLSHLRHHEQSMNDRTPEQYSDTHLTPPALT